MTDGAGSEGPEEPSPASWRWKPRVPFERVVDALCRTAGWLSGQLDPDTYYRPGDPDSEAMLATYDGLLLQLAEMLEVAAPRLPLDWRKRDVVVEGLAAAGVPAGWMQLYE